jgi:hypothetical protein
MRKIIRPKHLIFLLLIAISSQGCNLFHKSSRRKAEKKMELKDEKGNKEFEAAREQHIKNQSKQTRKMMKKTKRHADKLNQGKKKNHSRKHC